MKNKIITIAHQKGGVGKSSIAFNIAILLGANVIDLDVQQTMTNINQLRASSGMKPLNVINFKTHKELQLYMENYDEDRPLVIDCGGFDSSFNNIAISLADLVITPVSDERIELLGLKTFQSIVKNISLILGEKIKCFVLLNKIHPNTKNFSDLELFIKNSEMFGLLNTVIRKKTDISDSTPAGFSVKEFAKYSSSDKEFDNLIEEIKNI